MADETQGFFAERLPGPGEEGSNADLLGRFVDFIAQLSDLHAHGNEAHLIDGWVETLELGLQRLVHQSEENAAEHRWNPETLSSMSIAADRAGFTLPLGLRAIRTLLRTRLDRDGRSNLFGYGGITFCELLPMRSVPFSGGLSPWHE